MSAEFDEGTSDVGERPVAQHVASVGPRQRVTLAGRVTAVRSRKGPAELDHRTPWMLRPSAACWMEVDLDDGTGSLALRWTGRLSIPGIFPGAFLRVRGTVLSEHGRLVILNPLYELG